MSGNQDPIGPGFSPRSRSNTQPVGTPAGFGGNKVMRFALRGVFAGLLLLLAAGRANDAVSAAPLSPTRPELLDAAFRAFLEGQRRWAYTETHTDFAPDGKARGESVIQYDPSLPYAEQYVPVTLNGREPTAKNRRDWAERGEQLAKRRLRVRDELAAAQREREFQLRLFNADVTLDLDRATVVAEDDATVTFRIPLREAGGPEARAYDAYQLTTRVNKSRQQFEQATFRQQNRIRVGAGKFYDGIIEVEFAASAAWLPSCPVKITRRSMNKPFFGKPVAVHSVSVRTHLRRVKPYDERFQVKLAPLRLIEF